MARGTKKRYFKKNKTRNNKKIGKQRRMKHSNKSRKRKQIKKSRKRKAGLKYYQLTPQQKKYLKEENIYTNEEISEDSNVEDFVKHHLAHLDSSKYPNIYRPRGLITNLKINKRYSKNINDYNEIMKNDYEDKKKKNTIKKAEAEAAAMEEAKAELKKTVDNAMHRLNNNKSDELKTIKAIQNAIEIAEENGVNDEDDTMKYAEKHLNHVYRQLEEWNRKRAIKELIKTVDNAMHRLNNNDSNEIITIKTIQNAIEIAEENGVNDTDVAMKEAKQHLKHVETILSDRKRAAEVAKDANATVKPKEKEQQELQSANRSQGKGLRKVQVVTEDDSDSESDYADFDDDRDSDPDSGGDDNPPWYMQGPSY